MLEFLNYTILFTIVTDVYVYTYLPFSDKLHSAAVCERDVSLMMAE
jgi:hypothetical protein